MFTAVFDVLPKVSAMDLTPAQRSQLNGLLSRCQIVSRTIKNNELGLSNYRKRWILKDDEEIINCIDTGGSLDMLRVRMKRTEKGFKEHVQKILITHYDLEEVIRFPRLNEYLSPRHQVST
jgi:hypothetical protein